MSAGTKFYLAAALAMNLLATRPVTAAADLELGRYLATECLTCHRGNNVSGTIPSITGLDPIQVVAILRAYRAGDLPNPVMRAVSSRLKDDEIEALAEYLFKAKNP